MIDSTAVRADFPILARRVHDRPLVYLDNAATTQKPHVVLDRLLAFYRESNSSVHRGAHALSEQASESYEAARETVRRFLHARDRREIIFTAGATSAINLVAHGFSAWLTAGDEVLVTEMEHHSNLVPWQMLCAEKKARLKVVPFHDDGTLALDELDALLTERTRLLALTQVSNVLGVVNPVRELVRRAHAREIPVLVDAAQAVPHRPVDVQDLDCDFLAFSGHKLYAATGVGVLYGKEAWLERLPPAAYGGGMVDSVELHRTTLAEPPLKFEAGTPNVAGALSLAAAIKYVTALGMEAIQRHEDELMRYAVERLAAVGGVRIHGPLRDRCGALSFNLADADGHDVALILDKLGIAVRAGTHCAAPALRHYGLTGCVRASFALYNTAEEIDALVAGVRRAQAMLL